MAETADVRQQLIEECTAMARFALSSGMRVPGTVLERLEAARHTDGAVSELTRIHGRLAAVVAPATPRSIAATAVAQGSFFRAMGSVRLLRRMTVAAGLSLAVFIGTAMSSVVTDTSGDIGQEAGLTLLINQFHFLSAAGIGASFYSLFLLNRFVKNSTYDPRFDASYWVRFALGVIAGAILADLVTQDLEGAARIHRATIAMLGGFSAEVVQRILNRLVESLEALVRGSARDLVANRDEIARVKMAEEIGRRRLRMASHLTKLRQDLTAGLQSDELRGRLDRMVEELIDEGESATAKKAQGVTAQSA